MIRCPSYPCPRAGPGRPSAHRNCNCLEECLRGHAASRLDGDSLRHRPELARERVDVRVRRKLALRARAPSWPASSGRRTRAPRTAPWPRANASRWPPIIQVFLCDPQRPWQRGSNENTNGLLRQYMPKGMDISGCSQLQLNAIARQLNERPRKALGFKTPAEMFSESVALTS